MEVMVPEKTKKRLTHRFDWTPEVFKKIEELAAKAYPEKYIAINIGISANYFSQKKHEDRKIMDAIQRGREKRFEKVFKIHDELMSKESTMDHVRNSAVQFELERQHGWVRPSEIAVQNNQSVNISMNINFDKVKKEDKESYVGDIGNKESFSIDVKSKQEEGKN